MTNSTLTSNKQAPKKYPVHPVQVLRNFFNTLHVKNAQDAQDPRQNSFLLFYHNAHLLVYVHYKFFLPSSFGDDPVHPVH